MIGSATIAPLTLSSRLLPWGYLLAITGAELATSLISPQIGLIVHVLVLIGLLVYAAAGATAEERKLALALTLAPLIRLLSLSLPLTRFPQIAWYPIVAFPLLLATATVIRQVNLSRQAIGVRIGHLPLQLLLMGGGFGLGVAEYNILQPTPLVNALTWSALWMPALNLVLFTGVVEELIFRGLLQTLALPVLRRWALFFVALLFAVLHIGYLSVVDVLFVFAVGMLFAMIVDWGGSLFGVSLAHGLTNITLFLIMPYLSAHPSDPIVSIFPAVVVGGTMLAIVAADILMLRKLATRSAAAVPMPGLITIRALRLKSGLTHTDLAQRTGLSARLLAEIEYGLRLPLPEQLHQIAQELGVAPQSLLAVAG